MVGKAQLPHPRDQGTLPRQSASAGTMGLRKRRDRMLPGLLPVLGASLHTKNL